MDWIFYSEAQEILLKWEVYFPSDLWLTWDTEAFLFTILSFYSISFPYYL